MPSASSARGAALAAAALAATPLHAAPLAFDRVFATQGEPAGLHYRVAYRAGGTVHRLEVWRDGDRRIRRDTDRALTSLATHAPGDAGYRLVLLDHRRRVRTVIDRTNLYRIGAFTDWFDLGHGLRRPLGSYRLVAAAPPRTPAPLRACNWYALSQGDRTTRICWDAADRLPLLIVAAGGETVWRITALDRSSIAARVFGVDAKGYVSEDANRDIEND